MTTNKDKKFPYEYGLQLIQGKWQPKVISTVYFHQYITYSDLRAYLKPISDTVLAMTLRRFLDEGILKKGPIPHTNPCLEGYCLTEKGLALIPVLHILCRWGYLYNKRGREHLEAPCVDCPIRHGEADPFTRADEYHMAHAAEMKRQLGADAAPRRPGRPRRPKEA